MIMALTKHARSVLSTLFVVAYMSNHQLTSKNAAAEAATIHFKCGGGGSSGGQHIDTECQYGCCGTCKSSYCCSQTESYYSQFNISLCDGYSNSNGLAIPGWLISLICIMSFMFLICVCKILIEAKLMRRSMINADLRRHQHGRNTDRSSTTSSSSGHGNNNTSNNNTVGVYMSRIPSYNTITKKPIQTNDLFQQETTPPPYCTLVLPKHDV